MDGSPEGAVEVVVAMEGSLGGAEALEAVVGALVVSEGSMGGS